MCKWEASMQKEMLKELLCAGSKDVQGCSMGPEEREFGRHTREESGHDHKCHAWECVWKIHKGQIGKALVNHTEEE